MRGQARSGGIGSERGAVGRGAAAPGTEGARQASGAAGFLFAFLANYGIMIIKDCDA